jgi:hypothetical protein
MNTTNDNLLEELPVTAIRATNRWRLAEPQNPPSAAALYRAIDRLRWELDAKRISTEGLG